VLIEQSAYANSWRGRSPAAKATFSLCGLLAAFAAPRPQGGALVAVLIIITTALGARIPLRTWLLAAWPALLFLGGGCLSLIFTLHATPAGLPALTWAAHGGVQVAQLLGRSLGALAALLSLALTTPLPDLIALLRRLYMPELLLDLMVLCYRMLFVFSDAMQDILSAQISRLGYATPRLALRSLGSLGAGLAAQIWQRTQALHLAAQSRANDGPLRFLSPRFVHARRDTSMAVAAGAILILAGYLA